MRAFETTCTRIAEALQTLVAEEALAVRHGDFAEVVAIQERASPLVDFLAAHPNAGDAHPVIAALRAERRATSERLDAAMGRLRDELCALELRRRQLARIAPAYGGRRGAGPQLSAIG